MTETEHLLACLAEECVEVAQRATKAMRFGLKEVQPGQELDNAQRIAEELHDLEGVLMMLYQRGVLKKPDALTALTRATTKAAKVEKFMRYARERGALE